MLKVRVKLKTEIHTGARLCWISFPGGRHAAAVRSRGLGGDQSACPKLPFLLATDVAAV